MRASRSDPVAEGRPPLLGQPPLVIGCGALAVELVALTRRAGLPPMDLTCLPAELHNRPERIAPAVASRIRRARAAGYDRIFVAYADCGTGGRLDAVLAREGVSRLEGAHCYGVYAGHAAFAAFADEEPGTFYLTDFLVRNFDRLVWRGLGLDRFPQLREAYFRNYRRVVYLAQSEDPLLTAAAEAAAARLGLAFERRFTGLGHLAGALRPAYEPTGEVVGTASAEAASRRLSRPADQATGEVAGRASAEVASRRLSRPARRRPRSSIRPQVAGALSA